VTVVGEVAQPKMIHVEGNRITIFEAIAQCGDVTMDGLRDNVKVIRFEGEETTVGEIDLTSRESLDSPFYYLQQNDVVYVEPTPKKKKTSYRNEDWPRYISMTASGLSVAYTLVYRMLLDPKTRISNQK
jgi:polysaccharide export outer membrane protein